jgi:hypothetical protein
MFVPKLAAATMLVAIEAAVRTADPTAITTGAATTAIAAAPASARGAIPLVKVSAGLSS